MVNGHLQGAEIASKRSASLILPRYCCKVFQLWMKKTQRSAHRYLPKDRKAQKGGTKVNFLLWMQLQLPLGYQSSTISTTWVPAVIKRWETQQFHRCKEMESRILKRYLHTCVQSSIICKSQKAEATQVAMDRRMNKQRYLYMVEQHLILKRKEILSNAVTWRKLEDTVLSQSVKKKRQILWFHFHKVSTVVKFIEQCMNVVARGWGGGKWWVTVEWL